MVKCVNDINICELRGTNKIRYYANEMSFTPEILSLTECLLIMTKPTHNIQRSIFAFLLQKIYNNFMLLSVVPHHSFTANLSSFSDIFIKQECFHLFFSGKTKAKLKLISYRTSCSPWS